MIKLKKLKLKHYGKPTFLNAVQKPAIQFKEILSDQIEDAHETFEAFVDWINDSDPNEERFSLIKAYAQSLKRLIRNLEKIEDSFESEFDLEPINKILDSYHNIAREYKSAKNALENPGPANVFVISEIKRKVSTWIKTYRNSNDPVVMELVKKLSAVYKAKILTSEQKLSKLKGSH